MTKLTTASLSSGTSFFEERRRHRRVRMILDLTSNLIRHDASLTYREAICLVDCARKAITDLFPEFASRFEALVRPRLEVIIAERWPGEIVMTATPRTRELVN